MYEMYEMRKDVPSLVSFLSLLEIFAKDIQEALPALTLRFLSNAIEDFRRFSEVISCMQNHMIRLYQFIQNHRYGKN